MATLVLLTIGAAFCASVLIATWFTLVAIVENIGGTRAVPLLVVLPAIGTIALLIGGAA